MNPGLNQTAYLIAAGILFLFVFPLVTIESFLAWKRSRKRTARQLPNK